MVSCDFRRPAMVAAAAFVTLLWVPRSTEAQQIPLVTVPASTDVSALNRIVVVCGVIAYDAPARSSRLFVTSSGDQSRRPDLIIVLRDRAGHVQAETYGENLHSVDVPRGCQKKPEVREARSGAARLFATYAIYDWPTERQVSPEASYTIACYFRGSPLHCQSVSAKAIGTMRITAQQTAIVNLYANIRAVRRIASASKPPGPVYYVTGQKPDGTSFYNERGSVDATICEAPPPQIDREGNGCYMHYGEYNSATIVPDAKALRALILSEHPDAKQVLIYVHGFNNRFDSAISDGRLLSGWFNAYSAQHGVPTIPVIIFSFPAKASDYHLVAALLKYLDDETNVAWAAKQLREFAATLLDDPSHPLTVSLMAHSMGNRLMMDVAESLRSQTFDGSTIPTVCAPSSPPIYCRRVGQIIAVEPDIDKQTFDDEVIALDPFVSGITLYSSTHDVALKSSQFIHGHCRAGEINCDPFFSSFQEFNVIDASAFTCDPLGHSYWDNSPAMLDDITELLFKGIMSPTTVRQPYMRYVTQSPQPSFTHTVRSKPPNSAAYYLFDVDSAGQACGSVKLPAG